MNRVLALSLRPTSFHDLIGQDDIINSINNQFRLKRLPHSYIISGPFGWVNKTILNILFLLIINLKKINTSML